jgi:hypothetical protein
VRGAPARRSTPRCQHAHEGADTDPHRPRRRFDQRVDARTFDQLVDTRTYLGTYVHMYHGTGVGQL